MQFFKKKLLCQQLIGLLIGLIPAMFANNACAQYLNGIPVLLYHHVSEEKTELPHLTVTPAEFERQMAMLKSAGFETIPPEKFVAYMRGQSVELPEKPILITFDDGYDDNYTRAFPILQEQGFTAVIFMVGVNIDREKRLSTKQIQEMSDYGISFGGHTLTHRDLTTLPENELKHEIGDIKKKLRQITARDIALFSYPYGYYNLKTWEKTEGADYQAAFTVLPGLNKPDRDNIYLLRRIAMYSTTDFDTLFKLLDANKAKTKLLEYTPEYGG